MTFLPVHLAVYIFIFHILIYIFFLTDLETLWDTLWASQKSALYLKIPLFVCLFLEKETSSIYKDDLFYAWGGLFLKFHCSLNLWRMGVDGDWMCHQVDDVLPLGNVSEDTNIWHVVLISSNGFWLEWNHLEIKLFTSTVRREDIEEKKNQISQAASLRRTFSN